MYMDKRNEFGETFVYISPIKRYLRLSKNQQFCELRYSMHIICISGPQGFWGSGENGYLFSGI